MIPTCDDCFTALHGRRQPTHRFRDVTRAGAYLIEECGMCSNPTRGIRIYRTSTTPTLPGSTVHDRGAILSHSADTVTP